MKEAYGTFTPPFISPTYELVLVVRRTLLGEQQRKLDALQEQLDARDTRIGKLACKLDSLKFSVRKNLKELLKPLAKKYKLALSKFDSDNANFEFDKDRQVIKVWHKTFPQQQAIEVPMPADLKAICVERTKVLEERDLLAQEFKAMEDSLYAKRTKLADELETILAQELTKQFLAKLPKKTLARLKAIAAG
jgi:hypothetical protein